ncbi:MAG: antibiotic biosynthesis monooxygenase, partial [Ktedonobacterales bacterium]
MSKLGLYVKFTTQAGQRDALAALLLDAAQAAADVAGCELYIVNTSPTEPDVIWVTEIWSSPEAHQESLTWDTTKAIIAQGRPLIAGIER